MAFLTKSGSNLMLGSNRFRCIGFNSYTALVDTVAQSTIQSLFNALQSISGYAGIIRTWCFSRGKPPTNASGNLFYESGGVLYAREATFVQLDMILDEARQRNIKLVLCLADNTTNYDTKATYVTWANNINSAGLTASYPYVGFFNSDYCRDQYVANFSTIANRVNTINGRTYKDDDTIAWWELGNELRYDVFDAEGGTQNTAGSTNIAKVMAWADNVAGRMKAIDTNHLIAFSSVAHTWQWVEGDSVSNGSGYGADYNLFGDLVNVDILDFHCYPTQGGGEVNLLKYGQRLGYANAISGPGFRAQLVDYVTQIKGAGKICVNGEFGQVREVTASTADFSLFPRTTSIKEYTKVLFDADIDVIILWSATITGGGSYSLGLAEKGKGHYWGTNANSNDAELMAYINHKNTQLMSPGKRARVF